MADNDLIRQRSITSSPWTASPRTPWRTWQDRASNAVRALNKSLSTPTLTSSGRHPQPLTNPSRDRCHQCCKIPFSTTLRPQQPLAQANPRPCHGSPRTAPLHKPGKRLRLSQGAWLSQFARNRNSQSRQRLQTTSHLIKSNLCLCSSPKKVLKEPG